MTAAGAQRKQRARQLKRQAIADAAVRLALDGGLEAATVDAVSEAANISRRTFFNYFSAKEDALALAPSVPVDEVVAFVSDAPAGEPAVRTMRALAKHVAESFTPTRDQAVLWRRHPQLLARAQAGQDEQLFGALMAAVARREGRDPTDAYPSVLVVSTFAMVQWAVRASWLPEPARTIDDLLDEAFDLLERGL